VENGSLVRVTGLWWNEDRNKVAYLGGQFGSARIFIFENSYKSSEKGKRSPDYVLYVAKPDRNRTSEDVEEVEEATAATVAAEVGD